MDRLTVRSSEGIGVLKQPYLCKRCGELQWSLLDLWNGRPLDRLAEYEDLEEQGKLLKLPCKVGDTVYYISEKSEKQGRKKVLVSFIVEGTIDNIVLGSVMIPQITVCDNENKWTTFDSIEDIGKTVFLTRAEAEEALRKMDGMEGKK